MHRPMRVGTHNVVRPERRSGEKDVFDFALKTSGNFRAMENCAEEAIVPAGSQTQSGLRNCAVTDIYAQTELFVPELFPQWAATEWLASSRGAIN